MDLKYFLLQSKYDKFNIGSIFKKSGNNLIINVSTNEAVNEVVNIPKDWLEISKKDAEFLIKIQVTERIKIQKLNNLNVNEQCYYIAENNRYLSTFIRKIDNTYCIIQNQYYGQIQVNYSQIELLITENLEKITEILELLLDPDCDIQRVDNINRSVLLKCYELKSKSYFKMLINNYNKKLDINNIIIQTLLECIVEDQDCDILNLLLEKCEVKQCNSEFLMKFGLKIVKKGVNKLLNIVFKYIAKTTMLNNGETFLTNLFREQIDENTMIKVVETKLFNLNLPNNGLETPLILACTELMAELVKSLLLNGADPSYKNHAAFEATVFAKTKYPLKEKEANEIKNSLMNVKAALVQNNLEYAQMNLMGNYQGIYNQQRAFNAQINLYGNYQGIYNQQQAFNAQIIDNFENNLLKVMTLLFTNRGDLVKKNANNECVFSLTYNMKNQRFFKFLIMKCKQKMNFLVNCQEILLKVIEVGEINILKRILNISIINDTSNDILLTLALKTIIKKMEGHWKLIVERCTNKNIIMKNNETFLTSLVKENVDPKLILNVLSSNLFDVNKINGINETMLMLACERLLTEVVEVLLKIGADLSHNNYQAVDKLVINGNNKKVGEKTKIIEIIINVNKVREGPFKSQHISKNERIFKNIKINSKVIYYKKENAQLHSLYGVVKWTGVDKDNKYLYGIELEEKDINGTDGEFETVRLFHCLNGHGVVVSINSVAPDTRLLGEEDNGKVNTSLSSDVCHYCFPVKNFRDGNYGIEASENSQLLDTMIFAIFAKSHVLDHLISPVFNGRRSDFITKDIKYILSWDIIYALREFGFVSFHKMKHLKNTIQKYGAPFENVNKSELGMDVFANIITKLSLDKPLLKFLNFENNVSSAVFIQLFSLIDFGVESLSTQTLLEISISQKEMMFQEIPATLILYISKEERTFVKNKYCIPSKDINISQLFFNGFKECFKCNNIALYQCKNCVLNGLAINKGLFCAKHKCFHKELLKSPVTKSITQSNISMSLKAIISINNDYSVAYVKENEFYKEWICFDNKKSLKPTVKTVKNITRFLNKNENDMLNEIKQNLDPEIKSVLLNSYIYLYENEVMSCY